MYTKSWLIIRDDSHHTFEVCGQASDCNSFNHKIVAMQKAGMNVSHATPPVTNTSSNKDAIKIVGYVKQEGLYDKLLNQYRDITMGYVDDHEE